ncbi:MAG: GTPase HflX [Leptospiraceae bacterium]|nr:GTPase HflX [Leptospiraceae bacterium]
MQKLKKIGERRVREDVAITVEIARSISEISNEIGRRVSVSIDRTGYIQHVIVGNDKSIEIPELDRTRAIDKRLRGLRLFHSYLKEEQVTEEDLMDMVLLRMDYVTISIPGQNGIPKYFISAHINTDENSKSPWIILEKKYPGKISTGILQEIETIEDELGRYKKNLKTSTKVERAFLINVSTHNKKLSRSVESSIEELKELCRTAGIEVVDTFFQKRQSLDPTTVMGSGKIKEIILQAVHKDVDLLIFDLELSPSQAKKISYFCDLKVIDRTQLILDIFAKNAKSRDGKLQVELAQLKYLKGRLTELDDNMSRLTGGIGGRGPGETKLEIGKRRVEERIAHLEKELKSLKQRRELNRKQRKRREIPVVAIIGYTNTGKSTLLNALTNSDVISENKLFATLDPTTRRVRFPEEREIILSDTVGFIHDLPPELSNAFKATLEELGDADLLLHVVDISNPSYKEQIGAVEGILTSLNLEKIEKIDVYNKVDLLEDTNFLENSQDKKVCISAIQKTGFVELLNLVEKLLWAKEQS